LLYAVFNRMRIMLFSVLVFNSALLLGQGNNYFAGTDAGLSNTFGAFNTFVGSFSGYNNTMGSSNSFYGSASGFYNSSGVGNIAIGDGSGPTISNGNQNYRLYIDVNNSLPVGNDNPLIYGEFDNDFVRINGTFEVTAGLSNPSSRRIKNHFVSLDASSILAKLASMDIQQWTYKHRTDEKHIGPVAEDFYELFELGEDNTKISTIDADGVMMLSIQALKKENDEMKSEINLLKIENEEFKTKLAEIEILLIKDHSKN